jgi:ribonuclease E
MMCSMSDGMERPTAPNSDGEGSGVLGNLPRTRPQRASARRDAARRSAGGKAGAATAPARSSDGDGKAPSASAPAADASAGATETRAARSAGARRNAGQGAPKNSAGKGAADGARRRKRSATKLDAVPAQGYESEDDAATGAVRPPGGAELVLSAAEIVGELAKAGLSRSERLLKDVLSHLPLS